ncbi:MAG: hypothetical protein SOZ71_01110 [Clostridium sp.]|nr:hypothetical protein [Clostridium sp.]
MRKKSKFLKVILTITVVLLLVIFLVPGSSEYESEMGINKQNYIDELDKLKKFTGECDAEIEVVLTEGDAIIQLLNENKEVLWKENFNVGTSKIKDIKLENFTELYLEVITTTGDGEMKVKLSKNRFGFDKFDFSF